MARKSRKQIEAEIREREAATAEHRAAIERLQAELDDRWPSRGRAPKVSSLSKTYIENNKLDKRARARGDEIPPGWERAAAEERGRLGLVELNLIAAWRKLVAYDADKGRGFPTLGRWLLWAIREWLDHTNHPNPNREPDPESDSAEAESGTVALPQIGTDRERARADSYRRTGKWAPPGQAAEWGPAPGMPGCTLPAELAAWAQQNGPAKAAGPLQGDGVAAGLSRRAGSHTGRSGRARAACAPLPA
jgi:hypothetical protein